MQKQDVHIWPLSSEEFNRLTQAEKMAYLAEMVAVLNRKVEAVTTDQAGDASASASSAPS